MSVSFDILIKFIIINSLELIIIILEVLKLKTPWHLEYLSYSFR